MATPGSQPLESGAESGRPWSGPDRFEPAGLWTRVLAFLRRAHQAVSRHAMAVAMAEDGGRDLALEQLERASVHPREVRSGGGRTVPDRPDGRRRRAG